MTDDSRQPFPDETGGIPTLVTIRRFVETMDAANIDWCHWKSNRALDRALSGRDDLDLLIAGEDLDRFADAVRSLGALETINIGAKFLPGLYDWLLLDEDTGTLVHLHVHERLVLGEQRVKNHHLPVERFVLDHLREVHGVRIPTPEVELLLLWVRSLLKSSARACFRTFLGRQPSPFPDHIEDELMWLLSSCSDVEVVDALAESGLNLPKEELLDYLNRARRGDLSARWVWRARVRLLRAMRPYLRVSKATAIRRKLEFRFRYSRPGRKVAPVRQKRVVGGGLLVAFVGADGSGKSSVVTDLAAWSRRKLSVVQIFNGQPKRDPIIRNLRRADRVLGRGKRGSFLSQLVWVRVARYRRRLFETSRKLTRTGRPVISDRYPLREFWEMKTPMDGPRLSTSDSWLDRVEAKQYEAIGEADLVVVLDGPFEVLHQRKPDTPEREHRAKVEAVNELAASGAHPVVDVLRPYEEVLRDAKGLWFRAHLEHQRKAAGSA